MTEIYTETSITRMRDGIREVLYRWRLPAESEVVLLNISENATFAIRSPDGENLMIVRIHRPEYHTQREIESELLWIESLRNEGVVTTAEPVTTSSGEKIVSIPYGDEFRIAVGFEFLSGSEPVPGDDLREAFHTLGMVTAKLHNHAKKWRTPVGFKRKFWDFDAMLGRSPLWGDWRCAIGLDREGEMVLEKTTRLLEEQLKEYGQDRQRFGLVHADLRLANLLIDDDRLSVIDFDDCGYSWFMYDFAAAISFMEEDKQVPDLQKSWVTGYRSVSPLSEEDEAALPMFVMLRRILLTAWLASHSETETAQELGASYTEGTVRLAKAYYKSV